jgi:hypothetical protein
MRGLLVCVVVGVVGWSMTAKADARSWFAYGVNTSLALRQNPSEDGAIEHTVMSTFGIQLKLLRFLGVELGYAPIGAGARDVRFDNPWNASALLYIVPTSPVGAYLKGGVGNSALSHIFSVDTKQTYHAGLGLEFYATDHLVLGSEFLFLTPGARTIMDALSGANDGPRDASYYVGPSHFRASFRASYYF